MRELTEDAVLGDGVGEDLGDGPVSGCGGDEEYERANFAGGEDVFSLAGVAALSAKIPSGAYY
jgi:hypothetical protein